jgi:O-antigen/teichoic acid export membrane protein
MNSTFKNLTKNYSILTISNIGSIVFGILSTPIILHNLSIDFFGVYTIVLSLLVITQVFNNMLSINVIGPKIIAMSNSDGLTKKKNIIIQHIFCIV